MIILKHNPDLDTANLSDGTTSTPFLLPRDYQFLSFGRDLGGKLAIWYQTELSPTPTSEWGVAEVVVRWTGREFDPPHPCFATSFLGTFHYGLTYHFFLIPVVGPRAERYRISP